MLLLFRTAPEHANRNHASIIPGLWYCNYYTNAILYSARELLLLLCVENVHFLDTILEEEYQYFYLI